MSDTVLKKVQFQGGFFKNHTEYSAENYWVDGDKIRWRNGKAEKIGGWVSETAAQSEDGSSGFTGVARDIHTWTDLQFNKYLAAGTHAKVELFNDNTIYDITPYRAENSLTDAISTTSGSSLVTITHTNHGLVAGDYVYVDSQASAVDGITLSGTYIVQSVTDLNNYVLESGTTASGTTALSGGALEINYLLEVGDEDNGNLTGYGGDTYGTPGSATTTTVNLTDAISTTSGSSTVTITHTAHGRVVGDEIQVTSQASAVDGIDLSGGDFTGDFEVTGVTDPNNYTIKAINNVTLVEVTASGTTALAGGALDLVYDAEGWGKPRAGVGGTFLRQWSFDNWGEDLIACVRNGKLYQWDATNGVTSRMEVISNAPTENLKVLVAQPTRFLVAFGTQQSVGGTFDPLTIRWPEQETLTSWTITDTNTAGEYRLPLGNYIVDVIQTKGEIIILTDNTCYSMRYIGGTDIFQFDILATNISASSQHCGINVNGIVYWMGSKNFYMYDGVVKPLQSTLDEYIFDQDGGGLLNSSQKEKVFSATNKEFNEIIWLYPSSNSTEIDRYVMFNYVNGLWYDGSIERTVWVDSSTFNTPYAINASGTLYAHEIGKDDDGSPMEAFIRSGEIDLDDGEQLMFVDKFVPDFKLLPNRNANFSLYLKKYPNGTEQTKGPYVFNNSTPKVNIRARARHVSIEYKVDTLGADFEIGSPRFSLQPDGGR